MPRITLKLITVIMAAALLAGCATAQQKEVQQRKEEAARIVERTITKPEASYITVEKYINLPPELLVPCGITYKKDFTVGEYVRVENTNTAYLEDCKEQIEAIRKLQPLPVK